MLKNLQQLWSDVLSTPHSDAKRERLLGLLAAELRASDPAFVARLAKAAAGSLEAAIACHDEILGWGWELSRGGYARVYPPAAGLTEDNVYVEGRWAGSPASGLLLTAFKALDWQRTQTAEAGALSQAA